jgi:hypothetical protein
MKNLTMNSLVRLATVIYVLVQYPKKNYSNEKLWCGEEAENCDGNDPVVRNDYLVKGGRRG